MSGIDVFAKDSEGNYFLRLHPTDVRFERASAEELEQGQAQWTMLNEWAANVPELFERQNGLEVCSFSNTEVDIYLARAAWDPDASFTLSTTEFGPVSAQGVDAAPYVEYVMHGWFWEADESETPDGEYVVLSFPEEDVRLDFFFAPGSYVRVVSGEDERLYQSVLWDDSISNAEAMRGWYCKAAEASGLREPDGRLDAYLGQWVEKIAGRGTVTVMETVAPDKARIEIEWPESAAVLDNWTMLATLDEEGKLVYENGTLDVNEFDENGVAWIVDERWEQSGFFTLNEEGELCWHDDYSEDTEDSVFFRE